MVSVLPTATFLREIRSDCRRLQEVRSSLRELTQNSLVLRNHRSWIVELLGKLRDQLAIHFALEEAHGYFDDASEAAPQLAHQAAVLRAEHAVLFETIRGIAEQADQCRAQRLLQQQGNGMGSPTAGHDNHEFQRLVARFQHFDQQLSRHEEQENELMLDAFETDIGTGD